MYCSLARNLFDNSVIEPFLATLKINRTLVTLDLGDLPQARIASALKDNVISRELIFDGLLCRPELKKTRFLSSKINVFGEKNCGKSGLVHNLIYHEMSPEDAEKNLRATVNTSTEDPAKVVIDEFPKVNVRYVKTIDKLGFWEERFRDVGPDFTTEHAMRTAALLLKRKPKNKDGKPSAPPAKKSSGAENSMLSHESDPSKNNTQHSTISREIPHHLHLRRVKSSRSLVSELVNPSEDSISVDDEFSQGCEEIPTYQPNSMLQPVRKTKLQAKKNRPGFKGTHKSLPDSLSSFTSIKSKAKKSIRKTHQAFSKKSSTFSTGVKRKNTMQSVTSEGSELEPINLSFSGAFSVTGSEDSRGDSDDESEGPYLAPIDFTDLRLTIEKCAKRNSNGPDEEEEVAPSVDLQEYIQETVEPFDAPEEYGVRRAGVGSAAKMFEKLRKAYELNVASKISTPTLKRVPSEISVVHSPKLQAALDPDSNLRSFSHAFKEKESLAQVQSINHHSKNVLYFVFLILSFFREQSKS